MKKYQIAPGELREVFKLLGPTRTVDSARETDIDYTDNGDTVRARLRGLQGRELEVARQIRLDVTHEIVIRYHPYLEGDWRMVHIPTGSVYEITPPVDPDGYKRWLVISAVKVGLCQLS